MTKPYFTHQSKIPFVETIPWNRVSFSSKIHAVVWTISLNEKSILVSLSFEVYKHT